MRNLKTMIQQCMSFKRTRRQGTGLTFIYFQMTDILSKRSNWLYNGVHESNPNILTVPYYLHEFRRVLKIERSFWSPKQVLLIFDLLQTVFSLFSEMWALFLKWYLACEKYTGISIHLTGNAQWMDKYDALYSVGLHCTASIYQAHIYVD